MISKVEISRKIVHLVSLSIPIGYALMAKETALFILLLLFLGFLSVDLLRHYHSGMASLFRKYFLGTVLREKEKATLMGATYFLFSTLLTILLFPKPIAIASMLILILADTSAALVGKGDWEDFDLRQNPRGEYGFLSLCSLDRLDLSQLGSLFGKPCGTGGHSG